MVINNNTQYEYIQYREYIATNVTMTMAMRLEHGSKQINNKAYRK